MKLNLREEVLGLLARVSPTEPSPVSTIVDGQHRLKALRGIQQLEEVGLVEATRRRPKAVRVAASPFAQCLHGVLRTRPHLLSVLKNNNLAVLAVLATSDSEETVSSISERLGLHPNTVRPIMQAFLRRSFLQTAGSGYRLAPHVPELKELGHLFSEHLLGQELRKTPGLIPVARKGLRFIVESDTQQPQLAATGFYRFQIEGGPVVAPRFQYVLTPKKTPPTLKEAFADAQLSLAPPRTLEAARQFLLAQGETSG